MVTGVSRRAGIGFAVVDRLLADGASVFAQSWREHDTRRPWGADPVGVREALAGTPERAARLRIAENDLAPPDAADALVERAVGHLGGLDTLIVNHADAGTGALGDLTAGELDRCLAVNVRATLLLVQAFAARFRGAGGRVVLFSSGQHLGPMPGELAYVAAKGAIHQLTRSLADALADRAITLNTINPGPTDTGWADPATRRAVAERMPHGRWNTPAQAAGVVAMLLGPDAATLTGQVLDAEGGFRRT